MLTKRYETGCTAIIINEIVRNGYSEGWVGSLEEREMFGDILKDYNIYYTCDFNGRWTHKKA